MKYNRQCGRREIEGDKNRGFANTLLQGIHCILAFSGPRKSYTLTKELKYRRSDNRKVDDKNAVIYDYPNKCAGIFNGSRCKPIDDFLYLFVFRSPSVIIA